MIDVLDHLSSEQDRLRLLGLALERFATAASSGTESLYLAMAFRLDANAATDALLRKIDTLQPNLQTLLVQNALPNILGGRRYRRRSVVELPFPILERLVQLAFQTIRFDEDNQRPSGVVYSPDARDDAEDARSAAFKQLYETPGRTTYKTLVRLSETEGFPISPPRLRELARDRAAKDSEFQPWPAFEAQAFQQRCESLPRNASDLQRLMLGRLADLQHDLLHDDFAQGSTLAGLPNEEAVQNWMADRLQSSRGRSYTIERESQVAGGNEPDIRVRANDARVPLEIKVAVTWSLRQLEEALTAQLCERYLRSRDARHGILILVHQQRRVRGWEAPEGGRYMTFEEVTDHLRAMARVISGQSPDAPQPEIAVIDVSTCPIANPQSPTSLGLARPGKEIRHPRSSRRR